MGWFKAPELSFRGDVRGSEEYVDWIDQDCLSYKNRWGGRWGVSRLSIRNAVAAFVIRACEMDCGLENNETVVED